MTQITGVFSDPDDANRAFEDLLQLGYKSGDISVMMSHQTRSRFFGDGQTHGKIEANAGNGAMYGGVLGAAVGAAIVAGTALALGALFFATGPVALALAAIGGTAAAGSVIGALSHAGIPDELHGTVKDAVDRGDIVLIVDAAPAAQDSVRRILQGFEDVNAPKP